MSKNISIIGGGLIGQQWAMLFAAYGHKVFIYDAADTQVANCKTAICNFLEHFTKENISRSTENVEKQLTRIVVSNKYDDLLKTSDFVMECATENLDIKKKIFQSMDTYFSEDTIRMSSSSFLPISYFTDNLMHKSKCIIAHPVAPPYFLRLVEVCPAPYTDQSTVLKTKELMENIGQQPVILKKETFGFVLNRIQAAVFNSVFKIIKDDIVDINDVDTIITEGLGPRYAFYGPLTVASLNGPGIDTYCNKYLSSLDLLNKEQNYEPQHDENLIQRIKTELRPIENLEHLNLERNFNLAQVIKAKEHKHNHETKH